MFRRGVNAGRMVAAAEGKCIGGKARSKKSVVILRKLGHTEESILDDAEGCPVIGGGRQQQLTGGPRPDAVHLAQLGIPEVPCDVEHLGEPIGGSVTIGAVEDGGHVGMVRGAVGSAVQSRTSERRRWRRRRTRSIGWKAEGGRGHNTTYRHSSCSQSPSIAGTWKNLWMVAARNNMGSSPVGREPRRTWPGCI